jgi:hypothetical protein
MALRSCFPWHRLPLDVPSFVRAYHIRAPQILWFLGAGASAAAKIPTAGAMIWDFKRRLLLLGTACNARVV